MRRSILYTLALAAFSTSAMEVKAQGPTPTDIVAGWYNHFLRREPDESGLRNWVGYIREGTPILELEAAFLANDEYYQRHGGRPARFLQGLYRDVLGRGLPQEDLQAQLASLNNFGNRQLYIHAFLKNAQPELEARRTAPVPAAPPRRRLPPPPPAEESLPPRR